MPAPAAEVSAVKVESVEEPKVPVPEKKRAPRKVVVAAMGHKVEEEIPESALMEEKPPQYGLFGG